MSRRANRAAFNREPAFVEYAAHRARLARFGNTLAAQYFTSLVALTILMVFLLLGTDSLLIQLLFAGVVLLIPWHHSAAILFFLVQASLFIHEGPAGIAKTNYNPFIVSVVSLLFVACADRFRTSWRMFGDGSVTGLGNCLLSLGESPNRETLRTQIVRPQAATNFASDGRNPQLSLTALIGRLLRVLATAILAVMIAGFIVLMVPLRGDSMTEIRLSPVELRAFSLAILVLLIGLIASHLLSTIFWRTLSRQQASVYLRSTINQWLRPDAQSISWRRIKARNRKQRH